MADNDRRNVQSLSVFSMFTAEAGLKDALGKKFVEMGLTAQAACVPVLCQHKKRIAEVVKFLQIVFWTGDGAN